MGHSIDATDHAGEFCVPGPGPYAVTHSAGCLPKAARVAMEEGFIRPWAERGSDAWSDWLQRIDEFRAALAALFGGAPAEYCPQTNLSSALEKVLSAVPRPKQGKRVLLAAEDAFPSLGYVFQQQARQGFETRLIPREQSPALPETWSNALTSDVFAALVTHVHSNTGQVSPVEHIARLCAERNILCILDVAQSAGILPCAFHELGPPIILGSCVKWLCGGPGAGYMWVHPSLINKLEPLDVGWYSHANPFEMDIHSFEYAPDARRFWGGTPSIAPFAVAGASLRVIREIGVTAILAHNRRLMREFRENLTPAWRGRLPSGEMGGTLCIHTGGDLDQIKASLTAAKVQFDSRKDVIRLSFHACNTLADASVIARAWCGGR